MSSSPGFDQHLAQYAQSTYEIAKHYLFVGKWDAALKLLETALETDLSDLQKARLWCLLGHLYERRSDYERAEPILNQARAIAERENDQALLADTLYYLGEIPYFRCFIHQEVDHQESLGFHQQALAIREEIGDHKGQCFSLSRLGTIYERIDQNETALDYFQRAIELGESVDFEPGIWRPLVHIAFNHSPEAEPEERLALQTRAKDITQRYHIADGLVYTLVNVAYAQFLIDQDSQKAIEACKKGLAIGQELDFPGGVARDLYVMAMIAMEGGDTATAIDYFTRTLDYSNKFGLKRFAEPAATHLQELKEYAS